MAEKTGIAPQLLGPRKMLENVVIHVVRNQEQDLPFEFRNWRKPLMAEKFLAILEHESSQA